MENKKYSHRQRIVDAYMESNDVAWDRWSDMAWLNFT